MLRNIIHLSFTFIYPISIQSILEQASYTMSIEIYYRLPLVHSIRSNFECKTIERVTDRSRNPIAIDNQILLCFHIGISLIFEFFIIETYLSLKIHHVNIQNVAQTVFPYRNRTADYWICAIFIGKCSYYIHDQFSKRKSSTIAIIRRG